jgi:hypothetical protein
MRTAIKHAPALPPIPRAVHPGPLARAFDAWKAGWIAYAAALARAEGIAPALPWPVSGDIVRDTRDPAARGDLTCCG